MQSALGAVGQQQLEPGAVWVPPPEAAAAAQQQEGGGSGAAEAALKRMCKLQPEAAMVAETAAGMKERGRQRLNAEQRQAVAAVVCGAGRAYPYALFGPPGKGPEGCEAAGCCDCPVAVAVAVAVQWTGSGGRHLRYQW